MSDDVFTYVTEANTVFEVELTDYQASILGVFSQAAETRRRYAKKPRVLKQMRDDVADYVKAHPGRQMGAGAWVVDPNSTFWNTKSKTYVSTSANTGMAPTFTKILVTEEI